MLINLVIFYPPPLLFFFTHRPKRRTHFCVISVISNKRKITKTMMIKIYTKQKLKKKLCIKVCITISYIFVDFFLFVYKILLCILKHICICFAYLILEYL